jgi:hypothetical protein
MTFINKIQRKFQNLLGFEKLNPINDFDLEESFDQFQSTNNIDLFKRDITEHPELKEVIWISLYHCLHTYDSKIEYLTVLDQNSHLIADLVEGNADNVIIPDITSSVPLSSALTAPKDNITNKTIVINNVFL